MTKRLSPTEDIDEMWDVEYLRVERMDAGSLYIAGYNEDGPDYRLWPVCGEGGLHLTLDVDTDEIDVEIASEDRRGRLRVDGTAIGDVYTAHVEDGLAPEDVADELGMTKEGVHLALYQYYHRSDDM